MIRHDRATLTQSSIPVIDFFRTTQRKPGKVISVHEVNGRNEQQGKCVWDSQQVASGHGPRSHQTFEPLPCMSLFQQSRKNNLQQ